MSIKTIVCGVTGSKHAQAAALEAAALAKKEGAQLVYVYVVDSHFFKGGMAVEVSSAAFDEALSRIGQSVLDAAEQLALSVGVTPKKMLKRGEVLKGLQETVTEEKADLLMLGHEKRTFFEKAFFKGDVEDHIQELKDKTGVSVKIV